MTTRILLIIGALIPTCMAAPIYAAALRCAGWTPYGGGKWKRSETRWGNCYTEIKSFESAILTISRSYARPKKAPRKTLSAK